MSVRVAWFSPFPPDRTGVAAYSAELVPQLRADFDIDLYAERAAHDFVWRHRQAPYDLTVYQLGNAPCHDYMWAYMTHYPGLVVLHDGRLHHARARQLLRGDGRGRGDGGGGRLQPADQPAAHYRAEFRYDHPSAPAGVEEYAVAGLGGAINYFWSMLRVPVTTARTVAVHNAYVAADLARRFPAAAFETIRMGVPDMTAPAGERARVRQALGVPDTATLFAVFGKVTREKRVPEIVAALGDVRARAVDARLLVIGAGGEGTDALAGEAIHVAGHVPDADLSAWLSAADVCLCLRWPTALETSAAWLRCLAARRATVVSNLAHLADVPESVSLRIDVLDERRALAAAMHRLAAEPAEREALARDGHAHWRAHHTLGAMADDYRRVLTAAAGRRAPWIEDLPPHVVDDYGSLARDIVRRFGVERRVRW